MPATIYQETARVARPTWALTALLAALLGAACKDAPAKPVPEAISGAATTAAAEPTAPRSDAGAKAPSSLDGKTLHFTNLQRFAPDALLDFQGGKLAASTAQIGEVAVSEVERTYSSGARTLKLRLVDTSLNRGARAPKPGEAYEDDRKIGRPLGIAGASGYLEFEKESRRATANLIVTDRVLVTLTLEDARGPEDLQRLAVALDLRKLDALLLEDALRATEPARPR
ncbi:MAG: hypothetical protein QM765_22105 [Myxococcales bacterium]